MVRGSLVPSKGLLLSALSLALLTGSTALAADHGGEATPAVVNVRYTLRQQLAAPSPSTEVVFAEVSSSGGQPGFWIAERRVSQFVQPMLQHQWIDGRRCQALNTALEKLKDIPLRFGADRASAAPLDVAPLELSGSGEADSVYAITVQDYFGPLYEWWRSSQPSLDHCWQENAVMQGDRPLLNELPTRGDLPAL